MTLNSATSDVSYNGDGSTTAFATTFKFIQNADVVVVHRDAAGTETTWVLGTQYTLSGAGNDAGGTVTVSTSPTDYTPASGETLTILRQPAETQLTALPLGGPFPSTAVEDAIDLLTMLVQAHTEQLTRTPSVSETDQATSLVLPNELQRASKFFAFDASGNAIASAGPTGDSSIPVSAYIETLLDDADAGTARTTLGLVIGTDVQADLDVPSQAEAEAGTATDERVWTAQRIAQAIAALAIPRSYLAGLALANAADADHDITAAVGECRDAADAANIVLASALTKQIDASWAAGDAAGGLSSSLTVANDTWYHVHAILVAGAADIGFDTSLTAANLVTDHSATAYRRIGSVLTDGSANIIAFKQDGDLLLWADPPADDTGSITAGTQALATLTVPTGVKVRAFGNAVPAASTSIAALYSPDHNDESASLSAPPLFNAGSNAAGNFGGYWEALTDTSAQVRVAVANATGAVRITTQGWHDRRGRDA